MGDGEDLAVCMCVVVGGGEGAGIRSEERCEDCDRHRTHLDQDLRVGRLNWDSLFKMYTYS